MPLKLEDKKQIVADVQQAANDAICVVVADYRGISSPDMTGLRAKARELNVHLRVIRNTLARRAFKETPYACLTESFQGPVVVAFSTQEPSAAARLFKEFAKKNDALKVRSLSLGETVLDESQLDFVASLPTKEEAIAKLLNVLQAPMVKLVRTLGAANEKLVRTLVAVKDKKQSDS